MSDQSKQGYQQSNGRDENERRVTTRDQGVNSTGENIDMLTDEYQGESYIFCSGIKVPILYYL